MFKNKTKIIIAFLIVFLILSSTIVFANNEILDDEIMPISDEIPINEVESASNSTYINHDVFLTGDNVTIDYIVDGNLFVFANTVTINSQIGGDAFICANTLAVEKDSYIFGNLFTMANSIEIKGVVYGVYATSQNFTISSGYISRDLKVNCDTLTINSVIDRDVFANCNTLSFNTDGNSNGIISGNLNYSSYNEALIPDDVVEGDIKFTPISLFERSTQDMIEDYIFDLGTFLTFLLIIWLTCLLLTPKFLQNTNQLVGRKTLNVLGIGLLSLIVIPIVCIILIFLSLTSTISLVLLTLYILAIVISKSLFTITANNYICSKLKINKNLGILGMLIISGAIIWILTKLPYVGGITSFITVILGLGILITSIIPKKTKTIEVQESIVEISENSKDNA